MLRVLIPINEFPTDINNIRGGVHAALKNLLIGFSKKGIIVRVISFNKEIKKFFLKLKHLFYTCTVLFELNRDFW